MKPALFTYEKPSRYKQWQEKSAVPVTIGVMTFADMETLRKNLVISYNCADTDITYDFLKIVDQNDDDMYDCLWLKYFMKCVVKKKPQTREIFSIKIPVPHIIKKRVDDIMNTRNKTEPKVIMPPVKPQAKKNR
jgi:hypothetical protein